MGSGRTEMMRTIFGLDSLDRGEIWVKGKKVIIHNPNDAMKAGIGFVTEDRKDEGLVLDFSVRDNIYIALHLEE
jgi:ribose transport system ATP-binding protein